MTILRNQLTTRTQFAMVLLAALTAVSSTAPASAQGISISKVTVRRAKVRRSVFGKFKFPLRVRRPRVTKVPPKRANSLTFAQASELMAPYKQWVIGAKKTRLLYPKKNWNSPSSSYNLKGLVPRKFLQYEKTGWGRGINLGWTDNASAKTAAKRAKWFFSRKSNSRKPIVYGERLALAWGNSKNHYIKYGRRKVGINLKWSKNKPVYEWTILGGKPGYPVRNGIDHVIIYNTKHKQPLIYFNRKFGGHIGWPDSKTWKQQVWKTLKKYGKKYVTLENAAIVLGLIFSGSGSDD